MIGFIYPHDGVERMNLWKQLMLTKFDVLASVPSTNRMLYEHEVQVLGPKHGIWDRTYYEMWYLTRKVHLDQKWKLKLFHFARINLHHPFVECWKSLTELFNILMRFKKLLRRGVEPLVHLHIQAIYLTQRLISNNNNNNNIWCS